MSNYCKIYYAGSCRAPYNWITSTSLGTNRLIYMTGGEGGYVKDGVKIPFKKDCLYLMPGNAHYIPTYTSSEIYEERLDHVYANFEIVPPIATDEVLCIDYLDDDEMRIAVETFKVLGAQCALCHGYPNLNNLSKGYLTSTVKFIADKIIEKYNLESVQDKVILKALRIMHENLDQKQTVSEIAEKCFLSTNGFIKRFKKEVGETPYSYLKKLKIRTAQNMRMSGVTLEEIAEKCGYSDSSALLHAIGKNNIG